MLFDLLHLDGHDLYVRAGTKRGGPSNALTYEQRRGLLESLIDAGPNWQVPAVQQKLKELTEHDPSPRVRAAGMQILSGRTSGIDTGNPQ